MLLFKRRVLKREQTDVTKKKIAASFMKRIKECNTDDGSKVKRGA